MITEREIETVARAICDGHGYDPEELRVDDGASVYCKVPAWWLMRTQATTQIAAYRSIKAFEEGLRIRRPVGDGVSLNSMAHPTDPTYVVGN